MSGVSDDSHHFDGDGNLLCMDDRGNNECIGTVEYHTVGSSFKAWPRCRRHFDLRMDSYENSMERYSTSDVVPSWFSPEDAGERWFEDE